MARSADRDCTHTAAGSRLQGLCSSFRHGKNKKKLDTTANYSTGACLTYLQYRGRSHTIVQIDTDLNTPSIQCNDVQTKHVVDVVPVAASEVRGLYTRKLHNSNYRRRWALVQAEGTKYLLTSLIMNDETHRSKMPNRLDSSADKT